MQYMQFSKHCYINQETNKKKLYVDVKGQGNRLLVSYLPKLPTQHFAASKSGVCIINSWVLGSYVAVVLISLVLVP